MNILIRKTDNRNKTKRFSLYFLQPIDLVINLFFVLGPMIGNSMYQTSFCFEQEQVVAPSQSRTLLCSHHQIKPFLTINRKHFCRKYSQGTLII